MSYVIAAYGLTILILVLYAGSLHRERSLQADEERRRGR